MQLMSGRLCAEAGRASWPLTWIGMLPQLKDPDRTLSPVSDLGTLGEGDCSQLASGASCFIRIMKCPPPVEAVWEDTYNRQKEVQYFFT